MDATIPVLQPLRSGPASDPQGPGAAPQGEGAETQRPGWPPGGGALGAFYTMIAGLGIGVAIGWAIDRHFGTRPWWTIGISMFFLVVGMYHVIRASSR